ncbi:MAG: cytochrome P450 [Halioglobus sp.]|nr:cytochrome P450 [Halioglobus sp.]
MGSDALDIHTLMGLGPMAPVANPYPLYKRLRDDSPVLEPTHTLDTAVAGNHRTVLVTRYADVKACLADNETFGSDIVNRTMGLVMGPTIVGMNGREHLKHRTLITPSMTPRVLKSDNLPQGIEGIAHEYIDRFVDAGSVDLHEAFFFHFPLTVFVSVLGLPAEDVDAVHHTACDLCLITSDPEKGLAASEKLLEYFTPIVEERRNNPSDDILSKLIRAEVDGENLSDFEIISFLRLLVLAGAETTNHLLGSCFYQLIRDRELMEQVRADRGLVPTLIGETMRWESPISTVVREALVDTEIGGVEIEKGVAVNLHIGSANRDERKFEAPDEFRLHRADNDHISFGFGPHYCAGSHLAKLEAEIGINTLLDRLDDITPVAGEPSDIIGFAFRGPDRVPVTFRKIA